VTRFRSAARLALVVILCGLATSIVTTQQKPPVFRSRVDLRQLDVTVLDKDRRPVKDLTERDFSISEDGVAQKIEAFSFVDLGDLGETALAPEPVWALDAASDVASNDLDSARVFAIVINDASGMGDLWAENQMPKSLKTFVADMGPQDVAAVIFVGRGDRSVNFTRDKARLIHAVDGYLAVNRPYSSSVCAVADTLQYLMENLSLMKNRRKNILVFTGSAIFSPSVTSPCYLQWREILQLSAENNIAFYPVDTNGLRPWQPGDIRLIPDNNVIVDNWISLAHYTGGHAIINSNSFTEGLKNIYAENSSYYLLAYQPTNSTEDGRFRSVKVRVDRPDVEVTSTRSYWATKAPPADKPGPPPPSAAAKALAGVLPLAQMSMRASAAPFRSDSPGAATVAVSLALMPPAFLERTRESVDLLILKVTPDGIDYGSETQTISIAVPRSPEGAETSLYEVLARVDLPKPGKYDLRFSAHSDATDRRGAIYVDVDVPDFEQDKLSLSGVIVNALPSPPVGPVRLLSNLTPLTPTTSRVFGRQDIVTAFVRAYQGGKDRPSAVSITTRVVDSNSRTVTTRTETLTAAAFAADRSAPFQTRLPLESLDPGQYLLTLEAAMGKSLVHRDVRFDIR
jgi:VWFA-related protein